LIKQELKVVVTVVVQVDSSITDVMQLQMRIQKSLQMTSLSVKRGNTTQENASTHLHLLSVTGQKTFNCFLLQLVVRV